MELVAIDVIELVVEFVPSVSEVLQLRLVNTRWRDALLGAFASINGRSLRTLDTAAVSGFYRGVDSTIATRLAFQVMLPVLSTVKLSHLQLPLLSALRSLQHSAPSLQRVDLRASGAEAKDVAVALALPSLEALDLFGCTRFSDTSVFFAHEVAARLRWLCLACTGVGDADVARLSELATLEWLSLSHCRNISCVTPLEQCSLLRYLNVSGTAVREVPAFAALTEFNGGGCLSLSAGQALARCPLLEVADLTDTCLSRADLVEIACAPALRRLTLDRCTSIRDVEVLGSVRSLTQLSLADTAVDADGLWGLEDLPHLESLSLAGCRALSDVDLLANCPALRSLALDRTAVTSGGLEALRRISTLTELSLQHCRGIESLQHVAVVASLRSLILTGTAVTDAALAAVSNLTVLKELNVANCDSVASLAWVSSLSQLVTLNAASTLVRDLSPLRSLRALTDLDVSRCPVASVAALVSIPRLSRLVVSMDRSVVEAQLTTSRLRHLRVIVK